MPTPTKLRLGLNHYPEGIATTLARIKQLVQPLMTDLLDQITQRLVSALQPEQIILFGSYAYGEPNADSDIDLLVIVSQSDEPRYRRARVAYKALRGLGIPKDILVMTREEVERKKNVASSLVCQALRQGKVLYG